MVESLFVFFPVWLAMISMVLALSLPLVQSCREWARKHSGQAPPLNGEHTESR